jgi:hypothetical protein
MRIERIISACAIALATIASVAGCAATGPRHSGHRETLGDIATSLGVPFVGNWHDWSPKGDVDGEVGHPLSITGPRGGGGCDSWRAEIAVVSGQLPPGLVMGSSGDISGIPTERGHWIVTLKMANFTCNGHRYTMAGAPDVLAEDQGWENMDKCVDEGSSWRYCSLTTIRFHITGSGLVH